MKYFVIVLITLLFVFGCSKDAKKDIQDKLDDANTAIDKGVSKIDKKIDKTTKNIKKQTKEWLGPVYTGIDRVGVKYDLTASEIKELKRKAAKIDSKADWDKFLHEYLKNKKRVSSKKRSSDGHGKKIEKATQKHMISRLLKVFKKYYKNQ